MALDIVQIKLTAMTAVLSGLIASHPDRESLIEAIDFFADCSRDVLLHSPDATDAGIAAHDETIELFKNSLKVFSSGPAES